MDSFIVLLSTMKYIISIFKNVWNIHDFSYQFYDLGLVDEN